MQFWSSANFRLLGSIVLSALLIVSGSVQGECVCVCVCFGEDRPYAYTGIGTRRRSDKAFSSYDPSEKTRVCYRFHGSVKPYDAQGVTALATGRVRGCVSFTLSLFARRIVVAVSTFALVWLPSSVTLGSSHWITIIISCYPSRDPFEVRHHFRSDELHRSYSLFKISLDRSPDFGDFFDEITLLHRYIFRILLVTRNWNGLLAYSLEYCRCGISKARWLSLSDKKDLFTCEWLFVLRSGVLCFDTSM